jgi:hypothetical protein
MRGKNRSQDEIKVNGLIIAASIGGLVLVPCLQQSARFIGPSATLQVRAILIPAALSFGVFYLACKLLRLSVSRRAYLVQVLMTLAALLLLLYGSAGTVYVQLGAFRDIALAAVFGLVMALVTAHSTDTRFGILSRRIHANKKSFGIGATVVLAALIIGGLFFGLKLASDLRIEDDLEQIVVSVQQYADTHSKLPDTISQLPLPAAIKERSEKKNYSYKPIGIKNYELCATFQTPDTEATNRGVGWYGKGSYPDSINYKVQLHRLGKNCYKGGSSVDYPKYLKANNPNEEVIEAFYGYHNPVNNEINYRSVTGREGGVYPYGHMLLCDDVAITDMNLSRKGLYELTNGSKISFTISSGCVKKIGITKLETPPKRRATDIPVTQMGTTACSDRGPGLVDEESGGLKINGSILQYGHGSWKIERTLCSGFAIYDTAGKKIQVSDIGQYDYVSVYHYGNSAVKAVVTRKRTGLTL